MRPLRARALGLGSLAMLTAPANAAPILLSGEASLDAGYAVNPFLQPDGSRSSISIGASVRPTLTMRDELSQTSLGGVYSRSEYLSNDLQPSETLALSLNRSQTFSERLSGSASLSYSNSRNSFAPVDDIIDTTTLGARQKSLGASGSLQWQASQRDIVSLSASATKSDYGNSLLGDNKSYSGSVAYRRVLSSRTNVGISMGVSRVTSDFSGDTNTYSPRVLLDHRFSEVWQFNGSLGLLFQRSKFDLLPFGSTTSTSKGLGFEATLCRKQTRSNLCFSANRDTSVSGLGGARTATTASVSYSLQLSERETLTASAAAVRSKSVNRDFFVPRENYQSADLGYRRQISRRLDGGVSASYRRRELSQFGTADGFTATLNLIARFGRQ